jgi:hypothetical protein
MYKTTRFNVQVFPYLEAVAQGVIESPIADLVESLNIKGICGTRASCAGHGWPWVTEYRPLVAFVCDMPFSLELSKMVDELTVSDKLAHCWLIEGCHLAGIGLSWRLKLGDARSFLKRRLLNQDFETLAQSIRLLGAEFQQRIVATDIDVTEEAEYHKNHQSSEPLGFHDFSKGIGILAFGATMSQVI